MRACSEWMSDSLRAIELLLLQLDAGRDDTARQLVEIHCDTLHSEAPQAFSNQIRLLRRLATIYFGHHFRSHHSLQARDIRMRALVCCVGIRYGLSDAQPVGAKAWAVPRRDEGAGISRVASAP